MLLLDEPLSALDLKLRKEMQIELKRLQHETGITFVFVTHDQEEALTMSDRIAVMSEGRILQIGSPREIYDRPAERFVASFIGETNFLDGRSSGARGQDGPGCGLPAASRRLPTFPRDRSRLARSAIAVRPEHVRLATAGEPGTMAGTLGEVVYFGTDTHYHVRLGAGEMLVARVQNLRDGAPPPDSGARVGVRLQPGADPDPEGLSLASGEAVRRRWTSPARAPRSPREGARCGAAGGCQRRPWRCCWSARLVRS